MFRIVFPVLAVALVYAQASSDDSEYSKEKRASPVRMFPFPRVGRSDPDLAANSNWESNFLGGGNAAGYASAGQADGSVEEYDADFAQLIEPSSRYNVHNPFARPGRSSPTSNNANNNQYNRYGYKRAGLPGAANGMWFGPRLGRVQKRNPESAAAVAMQGDH